MAAVIVVAALLCGVAVWQLDRGDASPRSGRPGERDPSSLAVVGQAQLRQLEGFSLLRTPPEGLPTSMRRSLRRPAFGLNPALAQRIRVGVPGSYWAVPGNGFLCVLAQADAHSTTGACARTADAVAHGVATVQIRPGGSHGRGRAARVIVGVAPDRAGAVLVRTGRSTETAAVVDNAFDLRDSATDPPDSLTLRGGSWPSR